MRRILFLVLVAVAAPTCVGLASPTASYADRADVDAYVRQTAARLEQPGVYVDPQVFGDHRLTPAQTADIRAQAVRQPSRIHLWVIPASRLRVDGHLAMSPRALVARLHRLVGSAGTYAVLTEARTRAAGQSFFAFQWAGSGPVYRTGRAARQAISCCAPDYHRMLRRFVARSAVRRGGGTGRVAHAGNGGVRVGDQGPDVSDSTGIGPGGVFAFVLIALAAGAGLLFLVRLAGPRRPVGSAPVDVGELRQPLTEEIEEVRQQISAADTGSSPADGGGPAAPRIAVARQALDRAHGSLTTMSTPADAQAVTAALADARYELAVATALREGRPAPARTPPCFVDPRHGPSVATRAYPASGLAAAVPVCAPCDAALAAGTAPVARSFMLGGTRSFAWTPYGPAWWYLMGYWGQQPFLGDLAHHQAFLDGGFEPAHHHGPDSGGGGFFGGGGGHHGGFGGGMGGGGHHGGLGGGMGGGHHGGGGGFGGGGGHGGGGHHG